MRLLTTKFVPVAVDQHIHRQRKDAEGELFAKVLKQAGRGLEGYAQGVYLFTPDGTLLAFANTSDAAQVKRLMATALKKFDPAAAQKIEAKEVAAKGPPVLPEPPAGGLIVDVIAKVLGGYEANDPRGQRYLNSLGRDHLWLRKDETEALAGGMVPESIKQRLVRYHLIDNTRGEPAMWRSDEVKKLELTLKDGKLTGTIHLETKAGDRGYQAELRGTVAGTQGKVTRFDLVVKGEYWGETAFTRGAPKGRYPFAVAFTIADADCGAAKVPPQAARGNVKAYLK